MQPHLKPEGGNKPIQRNYIYDVSREFEDIYFMQVRRLGNELGLIFSEDHGRAILTNGHKSVIFCLTNNHYWDGTVTRMEGSRINTYVYSFQWSTSSIFKYPEFRRLASMAVGCKDTMNSHFYPELKLKPEDIEILLEKHQIKLDGNLDRIEDGHSFYIWIIDKGTGPFHYCINCHHDALFFEPVKIIDKETGQPIRW